MRDCEPMVNSICEKFFFLTIKFIYQEVLFLNNAKT